MYSGLRPETGAPAWSAVSRSQGPPCGPRWRRPAAASAKCKARVPRAAPARSSCITCSTGPRTVSSPWSPPPTCSNRTRRAGWDAMPAPTCATPCTATPAYAPSLAPPMPPTRARRIACANGWNATAPICANFAARARARARAGQRHSGAGPAATVRPVRPAGPVRRRRAAGRRGIQLGRRAAQAWNTLRQNLRLESDALRHALRVGIGATLAVALAQLRRQPRLLDVADPGLHPATLFRRHLAHRGTRAGSVAGAIGASLLGLLLSTPLSVALAVLPIALGTFARARTTPCSRSS